MLSPREAAEQLAPLTRSEVVQVIGTKFVLYRPSHNKEKKDRIVLVTDKRQGCAGSARSEKMRDLDNHVPVRGVFHGGASFAGAEGPYGSVSKEQPRKGECSQ